MLLLRQVVRLVRQMVDDMDPLAPNKNRLNEMIKSKKLASVVTDGASNMRSTPDHEGPQPNPAGKSFVALLNKDALTGAKLRDDDTITLALHCLCHIINLAVRDGLLGCRCFSCGGCSTSASCAWRCVCMHGSVYLCIMQRPHCLIATSVPSWLVVLLLSVLPQSRLCCVVRAPRYNSINRSSVVRRMFKDIELANNVCLPDKYVLVVPLVARMICNFAMVKCLFGWAAVRLTGTAQRVGRA
jgi:hypothetical protein